MLTRHPKRRGWYRLPRDPSEPWQALWGVPGVYFEGTYVVLHQTHLPLLDPALTAAFMPRVEQSSAIWAEREARYASLGVKPRVVQQQALDFALPRNNVLLFDEMRLGKTLSALLMHLEWQRQYRNRWTESDVARLSRMGATPKPYGPLFVVAPLSTRAVWLGWIKRLFPGVPVGVVVGKTYDREVIKQPIVFGHYDVIHKWLGLFDIGTLILDEAHALTNPDSLRSNAAETLSANARHVVVLTGTPIMKYPPDLYTIANIAAPGAFGSEYEFKQRYGDPQPTAHGTVYAGISNEAELKARLSELVLRRLWRDCHSDLPPITRSVVVAEIKQAERNRLDVLAGKLKAERTNTAANLAAYRRVVSSYKLPTVLKEIERVVKGGPVVVWTWHKEFADRILKALQEKSAPVWRIHGDIAIGDRDAAIEEWRKHPNGVLIATMAVAGAGIDLSHGPDADVSPVPILAEIDYTPAVVGQTEMRTYDPTRPMDVIFVIANHIVDQRIVRALVAKLSAADPLGVGAAVDAIDALRDAVLGPEEDGDLDRLLEDLLAGLT